MNNKFIIPIVIFLLILLGGGLYVMSTRDRSSVSDTVSQSGIAQEETETSQKSLKDLLTAGIPQKCAFQDVSNGVSMEGTTYISGGKMRGDFSTTIEGELTTGHTIFDGNTSYVWMDTSSTGFKMDIDPNEAITSENESQQGIDLDKTIDYSCSAWLPDNSVFNPPTNITFTSFEVPAATEADTMTGSQNLCASCDALTGEAKTQCLTALNCN